MQNSAAKYRSILYAILIACLFVPLLQSHTGFIKLHKLNGATDAVDTVPVFSAKNWFDGTYQAQKEKIINDSFGFRSAFVKLHNEVDYDLFNLAHAEFIVGGKNGYLFETHYIDGYYGTDFLGKENIEQTMDKLQFINDTLAKLNKTLLLVIAPSKALYYPEYMPDRINTTKGPTNYDTYLDLLKKSNIHYIDFNSYFIANKNKSKYPLEPKNGVHWSMYGAAVAGDSLVKYLEAVRHITMPKAIWKSIALHRDSLFDIDVENSMNLLFRLKSPLMAYPDIAFEHDTTKTRPKMLSVGDSFYWGLDAGYDIKNGFSADSRFWYYYKRPDHIQPTKDELKDEIEKSDVVMLLVTTPNLATVGWGFINDTYDMFKGTNAMPKKQADSIYNSRLSALRVYIRNDKNWLAKVAEGARKDGIPLDSAITLNAKWVIEHEKKK
jgi:hypothetical protein